MDHIKVIFPCGDEPHNTQSNRKQQNDRLNHGTIHAKLPPSTRKLLLSSYFHFILNIFCVSVRSPEYNYYIHIKLCYFQDQVIIPLSTTGLKATQKSSDQEIEDDPLLVVHPNYVVDT